MPRAPTKPARAAADPKVAPALRFSAALLSPRPPAGATTRGTAPKPSERSWAFLRLPKDASAKLPSRGQNTVEGTIDGVAFQATLQPDGAGGHWLKVDGKVHASVEARVGDTVTLDVRPVPTAQEPEPRVPTDLRRGLLTAAKRAREVWSDITPVARRDWIQWVVSAKHAQTRARRISAACDMLAKGKRRPCCFDRSGMYGAAVSCPAAE